MRHEANTKHETKFGLAVLGKDVTNFHKTVYSNQLMIVARISGHIQPGHVCREVTRTFQNTAFKGYKRKLELRYRKPRSKGERTSGCTNGRSSRHPGWEVRVIPRSIRKLDVFISIALRQRLEERESDTHTHTHRTYFGPFFTHIL